jgi:hypothetical protein
MHDLEVLAGYTRLLDLQAGRPDRPHASLGGLLHAIDDDILRLHAQYSAKRESLDEIAAKCRTDFCPRLARLPDGTPVGGRGAEDGREHHG